MGLLLDRIFTSSPVQDHGKFLERLQGLLNGRTPDYLWVDNRSSQYRCWRIQKLYLTGERLERDTAFSYGGWTLVVHKGSRIHRQENGGRLQGGFSFRKEEKLFSGVSLSLDERGRFLFEITILDEGGLSAEIRYFTRGWDTFLRRWGDVEVRGEVFKLPYGTALRVCFSPLVQEETIFQLQETLEVKSSFTSVYGDALSLQLPAGFPLVFQRASEPEGRCYLAPGGRAYGYGVKKLELGMSGTEYVGMSGGACLCFVPGQPAWYGAGQLDRRGQTAYLAMPGGQYYSQSSEAPFFCKAKEGVYRYCELPAFTLSEEGPLSVFPFSGCRSLAGVARFIEQNCLGSIRRVAVEEGAGEFAPNRKKMKAGEEPLPSRCIRIAEGREGQLLISRSGMAVWLESGRVKWISLLSVGCPFPGLAFTLPHRRLMAAVQTNELFLVLASVRQITGLAGTPYSITRESLKRAEKGGYPYGKQLEELVGTTYLTMEELCRAVRERTKEQEVSEALLNACDHFTVELDGWTFRMGEGSWGKKDCIFLVKMGVASSVLELIKEPLCWSLIPDKKQIDLAQRSVLRAKERAWELKDAGLLRILTDSKWQGLLCFHVPVDVNNLPSELGFLAGGLGAGLLQGLYAACSASGTWQAFIDYQDMAHQYYPDMREFGFKVLELGVGIENGRTKSFSASAELLINRIFGGRTEAGEDSQTGNNLVFDGYYQREEGGGHYVFKLRQEQSYTVSGCALCRLLVNGGALQANGQKGSFVLNGDMTFDDMGKMDLYSYDRIGYHGLAVNLDMRDGENDFTVNMESLQFDLSEASVREHSFAQCFPLKPVGISYVRGRTPMQAGYAELKVSREVSGIEEEWYGIFWQIDLGNMGSLVKQYSLALELLTAWKPSPEDEIKGADGSFLCGTPKYFTGIRLLANGNAVGWEIPLEGVLTLGFGGVELKSREREETGGMEYYFRFRNFALRFLGLRFPQTNHDMYLISDENQTLGWYGSFCEGE